MSDASLAIPDTPAGPPKTVKAHVKTPDGKRMQIGRRLKVACDAIVWHGMDIKQAAATAGLHSDALRRAVAKPHVVRYLREQRQVFRESARAQNIHAAVEIRQQTENRTAQMQAVRFIEGISEQEERTAAGGVGVSPGVVVHVNVSRGPAQVDDTVIEVSAGPAPDTQSGAQQP